MGLFSRKKTSNETLDTSTLDTSKNWRVSEIQEATANELIRAQELAEKKNAMNKYISEIGENKNSISSDMEELDIAFKDAKIGFEQEKAEDKTSSGLYTKILFFITFLITAILQKYPNNEIARKIKRILKGEDERYDNGEKLRVMIELLMTLWKEEQTLSDKQIVMVESLANKLGHIDKNDNYYISKLNIQREFIEDLTKRYEECKKKLNSRKNPDDYSLEIKKLLPSQDSEFDWIADVQEREIGQMLENELEQYKTNYFIERAALDEKRKELTSFFQNYCETLDMYVDSQIKGFVEKIQEIEKKRSTLEVNDHEVNNNSLWLAERTKLINTISNETIVVFQDFMKYNVSTYTNSAQRIARELGSRRSSDRIFAIFSETEKRLTTLTKKINEDLEAIKSKQRILQEKRERSKQAVVLINKIEQTNREVQDNIKKLIDGLSKVSWQAKHTFFLDIYTNGSDMQVISSLETLDKDITELTRLNRLGIATEAAKDADQRLANWDALTSDLLAQLKSAWVWQHSNLFKAIVVYKKTKVVSVSDYDTKQFEKLKEDLFDRLKETRRKNQLKNIDIAVLDISSTSKYQSGWVSSFRPDSIKFEEFSSWINNLIDSLSDRNDAQNKLILKAIADIAEQTSKSQSMNLDLIQSVEWELYFVDHGSRKTDVLIRNNNLNDTYYSVRPLKLIPIQSNEWIALLEANINWIGENKLYELLKDSPVFKTGPKNI